MSSSKLLMPLALQSIFFQPAKHRARREQGEGTLVSYCFILKVTYQFCNKLPQLSTSRMAPTDMKGWESRLAIYSERKRGLVSIEPVYENLCKVLVNIVTRQN